MTPKYRVIAFLLLLTACASTALMLHYHNKKTYKIQKTLPKQPNLIVLQTSLRSFNAQGLLHFILKTPKAIHYPEHNSTMMLHPSLLIFTEKRDRWKITADNGMARHGNEIFLLWGNVKIIQPNTATTPKTVIRTNELTFYPKRSFAETAQPVTITRSNSRLSATGMTLDLKQGILKTKSETRGSYDLSKK